MFRLMRDTERDTKLQKRRFSGVTVLQKSRGNFLQNSEKKWGKRRKQKKNGANFHLLRLV